MCECVCVCAQTGVLVNRERRCFTLRRATQDDTNSKVVLDLHLLLILHAEGHIQATRVLFLFFFLKGQNLP